MEITKRKINQARIQNILKVIKNSQKRIPEDLLYMDSYYNGAELLQKGTRAIEKESDTDRLGVFISNEQLETIIQYLKECKHNEEADCITIGSYTHSNNKMENNSRGRCEYDVTDFAEIVVITSEKTILMHLNYINTIKRKIGTYVKIYNTSWKRLPEFKNGCNRKEVLLERIINTAALYYEQQNKVKFTTKENFMKVFNSIEAMDPGVLAKSIKSKEIYNNTGTVKILDFTSDENTMKILKMMYNKLKNDSLKVNGSGAFNDVTYISFEYKDCILGFEIGINYKRAELSKV